MLAEQALEKLRLVFREISLEFEAQGSSRDFKVLIYTQAHLMLRNCYKTDLSVHGKAFADDCHNAVLETLKQISEEK